MIEATQLIEDVSVPFSYQEIEDIMVVAAERDIDPLALIHDAVLDDLYR